MFRTIFLSLTFLCIGLNMAAQKAQNGSLQITTDPGIDQLQQQYIEQNRADHKLTGYRVQIYNGRKSETLNKRSEFISQFPSVPVYTLYEAPEYKVQVGDFRTRLEAEKFLNQVTATFGSGFVVKTNIQYPALKASPKPAKTTDTSADGSLPP